MRILRASQRIIDKWAMLLLSAIILFFLSLQFIASFNFLCPPSSLFASVPPLYRLLYNCGPDLYPFMSYGMYSKPYYIGEQMDRLRVVGVLADFSEVQIAPEDLGLDKNLFRGVEKALREENSEQINVYAALYEERNDVRLVGLRLENQPTLLVEDGFITLSPEVLVELHLDPWEEK